MGTAIGDAITRRADDGQGLRASALGTDGDKIALPSPSTEPAQSVFLRTTGADQQVSDPDQCNGPAGHRDQGTGNHEAPIRQLSGAGRSMIYLGLYGSNPWACRLSRCFGRFVDLDF